MSRRFFLIAGCGAIVSACGRGAEDAGPSEPGVIRFAIQQTASPASEEARWSPLFADLRASTGLKVRPTFVDAGAAVAGALHRRQADMALAASAPALKAVRLGDGEVFARILPVSRTAGAAVLVTGPRSRLTLDRVLKCDHTLTLGIAKGEPDEALLAADAYLFAPKGVGPTRCFRDVRAAPPGVLIADLDGGRLDAAIVDLGQLAPAENEARAGAARELWRSPPLPSTSLVWRRDLDPAIKEKLRQFFLTYGRDEAARSRLAALGLAGFAPADNAHLLVEREMEAAHDWLEARASGDKVRESQARTDFHSIAADRQDLEARTRTPAGAQ